MVAQLAGWNIEGMWGQQQEGMSSSVGSNNHINSCWMTDYLSPCIIDKSINGDDLDSWSVYISPAFIWVQNTMLLGWMSGPLVDFEAFFFVVKHICFTNLLYPSRLLYGHKNWRATKRW